MLPDGCGAQVAALLVRMCGRASALSVTPPIAAAPHVLRRSFLRCVAALGTQGVLYEAAGVLYGYSRGTPLRCIRPVLAHCGPLPINAPRCSVRAERHSGVFWEYSGYSGYSRG